MGKLRVEEIVRPRHRRKIEIRPTPAGYLRVCSGCRETSGSVVAVLMSGVAAFFVCGPCRVELVRRLVEVSG